MYSSRSDTQQTEVTSGYYDDTIKEDLETM